MAFKLRIGSRPSRLALTQSRTISAKIEAAAPGLKTELIPIRTGGDALARESFANSGGKGLFIKELEEALTHGDIDIAVHSMKDLPAVLADSYRLLAVPEREVSSDALITQNVGGMTALRERATVGTSSSRRCFEALRIRPDLDIKPLRGNVDTRLRRLAQREIDAVILAMAGLKRLGKCDELEIEELDQEQFVPAGGQGAIAIEGLSDRPAGNSTELDRAIASLNNAAALTEITAERAFLATLGATCNSPIGVKGAFSNSTMKLTALLFSSDGKRHLSASTACRFERETDSEVASVGKRLAELMLERGADRLLADV